MIPSAFDYRRATSPEEAVELLAGNDNAKLLAGGHSLLPMMKLRLAAPSLLIDIGGIEELQSIERDGDDLIVGALATHAAIATSGEVSATHRALAEAAAAIGDVQVRNCGTLGGSLAHADPAADYAAAVLALGATVQVLGPQGSRSIDAADLFAGLLTTTLEDAEIITAVRFAPLAGGAASSYEKFAHPASGFAVVGVAAVIARDDDGACSAARVAATGVSSAPLRLADAEAALTGSALDADALQVAADAARTAVGEVRSDLYAGEEYRRHLLGVLVKRAVVRAAS
jgi:carbon-monoxide dehydrogenase medium subunit